VPSNWALPGFPVTAPVCIPDVIGALAVWRQNKQKMKPGAVAEYCFSGFIQTNKQTNKQTNAGGKYRLSGFIPTDKQTNRQTSLNKIKTHTRNNMALSWAHALTGLRGLERRFRSCIQFGI